DKIRLAFEPARCPGFGRNITETHTSDLPARDCDRSGKDTVFGQNNCVCLYLADDRTACNAQDRVCAQPIRRAQRLAIIAGRIKDAIADTDGQRIAADFVFVNLYRANNAVLDLQMAAGLVQFQTWFRRAFRLAFMADSPSRNQSAVANLHFLHFAFDTNAAACHHQSVDDEAAASLAVDGQPLGPIPVLFVQIDDRTATVCSADLQT